MTKRAHETETETMSYLNPPPEVLAEWSKLANPENPPTQGNDVLVMEIVLTVVSVLVVALRIYVRVFLTKSYGLDDTLILVNMVSQEWFALL